YLPRTAPRWEGCEVFAFPLLYEVVTCCPVTPLGPGGPIPPSYHLNLITGQITDGDYPYPDGH
ncbi:MAG: hypothetical protein WCF36_07810, partial [Candidatus Nanopelagicales bacterium]